MRRNKKAELKAKSAWLVTWDGTSGDPEAPVVAIFNYRVSANSVKKLVELLYVTLIGSPREKLAYTKSPKKAVYPADMTEFQKINCGDNPWLYARRVTNLKVTDGVLTWKEPPTDTERRKMLGGK